MSEKIKKFEDEVNNPLTKQGITELKELLNMVIGLPLLVVDSLEDGKIGFSDVGHFVKFAQTIIPGLTGIENVLPEFHDLSDEEIDELSNFCGQKLSEIGNIMLDDDELYTLSESIFQLALHMVKAIKIIRTIVSD